MEVKIIKNKNIQIEEVKMTCDQEIKHLEKPLQSNFFYMMIGGPGSGKTNLIVNLISRKGKFYYKKFDRIEFWSPSQHTISKKLKLPDERFHNNLDFDEMEIIINSLKPDTKSLFIFDDCVSSLKKNIQIFLRLIYNRRHLNISIMLVSQVYNKIPAEIRKCASMLFFFHSNNKKEIDTIFDDFISLSRDDFKFICGLVFKKAHSFLLIDTLTDKYYSNFDEIQITHSK